MENNFYHHQNSIPSATSQNFIASEYQNGFQQQFSLGIVQQGIQGQHFQHTGPSQVHRSKGKIL